jgi:hypothetical protein
MFDQPENEDFTRVSASSKASVMSGPQRFGPQSGETCPGAQPPFPSGRDPLGLQGSQQDHWQHPFEPHSPLEQIRSRGQQAGKHASDSCWQYFQPFALTSLWHQCSCVPRAAPRAVPPVARPTSVTPSTPSARFRGIDLIIERASSSSS